MDLISIVVAVYNAEKTLEKCVDSLLNQTYKNTEIILVNDCSKDNSLNICNKYAANNSNVLVIDNPINMKVSATRNNGIKASNGKFICFVDSDDYVEPNYLEVLYSCYQKYNTVPICGFVYHDEVNKCAPVTYKWSRGNELVSLGEAFKLYDELYLTALWNKLFDNEKVKANLILFDENLSMGEDLKFSVEYFDRTDAKEVYTFVEPLYHYTKLTNDTLMAQFAKKGIDGGIENLKIIKNLAEKYNSNAEKIYNKEVENLKSTLVYFLVRDNDYSRREKIRRIREFLPDFTSLDYVKQRVGYYKEKLTKLIKK